MANYNENFDQLEGADKKIKLDLTKVIGDDKNILDNAHTLQDEDKTILE